ncbi:MAG: peptidylprolyl isomerase [Patescibacteria group bacterium]
MKQPKQSITSNFNTPESKDLKTGGDNSLRHDVLHEIDQYNYHDSSKNGIKRFIKNEPNKIAAKAKSVPKDQAVIEASFKRNETKMNNGLEQVNTKQRKINKLGWKIWTIIAFISFILLIAIFLLLVYRFRLDKKISSVVDYLPLPIAYVNGNLLTLREFNNDVATLRKYYDRIQSENGATNSISLDEIETIVLERMIHEQIVVDFAVRNNISISNDQINSELSSIITDFGGEDNLKEFVSTNYNWNLDDFKNKIIIPYLQREKVSAWFTNNESVQIATQDRAKQIKADIDKQSINFADAAKKYSDDLASATKNGSLGVFEWGTMVSEFEQALKQLQVDQISEPIKTIFGWHIIRRDALPEYLKKSDTYVSASHILIRNFNFDKWIEAEREKIKVLIFLKINNRKI